MSLGSLGKLGTRKGIRLDESIKRKMSIARAGKPQLHQRNFDSKIELQICKLYTDEKYSSLQIARKFNTNSRMIIRVLKRNNVRIRTKSESARIRYAKDKHE